MTQDGFAPSPVRRLLVATGAGLLAALPVGWLLPQLVAGLRGGPAGMGFEALLVVACETALVVCSGWLWLLVLLVLRDAARDRPAPARSRVPLVVRRWVLVACGLSLAGGLLGPAHAGTGGAEPATAEVLVGLAVPDRPATTTQPGRASTGPATGPARHVPASPATRRDVVVVTAGDTLWGLASHTLPPAAPAAAVDRRWREIYRANRRLVGADPDLIRPGQRLRLPDVPT